VYKKYTSPRIRYDIHVIESALKRGLKNIDGLKIANIKFENCAIVVDMTYVSPYPVNYIEISAT
jgi:hypothetical protein